MYKIYKHTMPDGKCYIGQTNLDPIYKRWNYGHGYRLNKPFYNDIIQVGWNNIQHEILEEVATKAEAADRERYYILLYRSNEPEFGYNKSTNFSSLPKTRKYVRCIETGKLYETATAVAAEVGVSKQAICHAITNESACRGKHYERVELPVEEYWQSKNAQPAGE